MRPPLPSWHWPLCLLALLWNLIGMALYGGLALMPIEDFAALLPAEQQMYRDIPGWIWGLWALATSFGAAGAIGLLLQRLWAVQVLWISLLATWVQQGYGLFFIHVPDDMRTTGILIALAAMSGAVALHAYARWMARKGGFVTSG